MVANETLQPEPMAFKDD